MHETCCFMDIDRTVCVRTSAVCHGCHMSHCTALIASYSTTITTITNNNKTLWRHLKYHRLLSTRLIRVQSQHKATAR
eukprot:m.107746 g.107746  ORF g.107746 m.107746 type:complete len:78 (-) comp13332_c0_seq2:3-236(-)